MSAANDEPLIEVEIRPTSWRSQSLGGMFPYIRAIPLRIAAKIQLGTGIMRTMGHAEARAWLRDDLQRRVAWTDEDRACLL